MRRTAIFLVLLLVTQLPLLANGQKTRPRPHVNLSAMAQLKRNLMARLSELREAGGFPGVTAAFVLPDGRTESISVGLSDVERKQPLQPNDRMLSGSIGKTYCAAVMMQLIDEKRANLDDKLSKWFGDQRWFNRLPNAADLTLRMVMNHTSGIPEHVLMEKFLTAVRQQPDRVWRSEELIEFVLDEKPLFAAGQGWSYADTNFILVGMVIEKITGQTFYRELDRRILKPLKLTDTLPSDRRVLPGLITGYSDPRSPFGLPGRVIEQGKFIINPQFEWTGGGLLSNSRDLARWARLLYEGKACQPATLAEMLQGVPAKTGKGDKYGLGVQIRETDWGVSYGHGGWFPGYLSEMEYFPKYRLAVAVQFNTDNSGQLKQRTHGYILELTRIIVAELSLKEQHKAA